MCQVGLSAIQDASEGKRGEGRGNSELIELDSVVVTWSVSDN